MRFVVKSGKNDYVALKTEQLAIVILRKTWPLRMNFVRSRLQCGEKEVLEVSIYVRITFTCLIFLTSYLALTSSIILDSMGPELSLHLPSLAVECDRPDIYNQCSRCSIGLSKRGLHMQPVDY